MAVGWTGYLQSVVVVVVSFGWPRGFANKPQKTIEWPS
jgi:hypothetical protein